MNQYQLKYKPYGDRSILIEWPSKIEEVILKDIINFKEKILQKYIEQKIHINHAYNSLLVTYYEIIIDYGSAVSELKEVYNSKGIYKESSVLLWKIPVCYDDSFGLDLEMLSLEKGLSKNKIIELHSERIYTVYFIGFLPGFLYLGGLNETLYTPRKASPRLQVKNGAVAIGGNQTGVYPNESPGGWNIIGNSPINFFDVQSETPCFAKAGDKIQFVPTALSNYHEIMASVNSGTYVMESEVLYD